MAAPTQRKITVKWIIAPLFFFLPLFVCFSWGCRTLDILARVGGPSQFPSWIYGSVDQRQRATLGMPGTAFLHRADVCVCVWDWISCWIENSKMTWRTNSLSLSFLVRAPFLPLWLRLLRSDALVWSSIPCISPYPFWQQPLGQLCGKTKAVFISRRPFVRRFWRDCVKRRHVCAQCAVWSSAYHYSNAVNV